LEALSTSETSTSFHETMHFTPMLEAISTSETSTSFDETMHFTPMLEALSTFETSVSIYWTTQSLHTRRLENLKSHRAYECPCEMFK
jgi:hypothetical protein